MLNVLPTVLMEARFACHFENAIGRDKEADVGTQRAYFSWDVRS